MEMVPELRQAFPDQTIVIRPHPSEKFDIYNELAARFNKVNVDNSGNIIPWLLACKAMLHNGCTTGIEAYLLGVPAISYLATFNKYYDYEFQGLPTKLSHQCFNLNELKLTLRQILAGEVAAATGDERKALIDHYLVAQDGPLACERVVNVLMESGYGLKVLPATPALVRTRGWLRCNIRAVRARANLRRSDPSRKFYQRHRFAELSVADIEQRIERFGKLLNRFDTIKVGSHSQNIFQIRG